MTLLRIPRTLLARIVQYGLRKELQAFAAAITTDSHPPRIYKASGVEPEYLPYQDLGLHHHHLHRDGDPLLVTQHIDGQIIGVALATHATYFQSDKMRWLKDNMEAIDWTECPILEQQVKQYKNDLDDEIPF